MIRLREQSASALVRRTLLAIVLTHGMHGCKPPTEQPSATRTQSDDDTLSLYVVNHPLEYFARRIGGENVEVRFPAPSDLDPAFWSPSVETIADYQSADLILLNGAGYARWVSRATLAPSKLVDTSAELRDRYIELADAPTHAHGPEGPRAHTGSAFTTWLDPLLAIGQARAIADALSAAAPKHEAVFRAAFDGLAADIEALDARLDSLLVGERRPDFLFSHPVYQYFQRRYGLSGRSFHWEPHIEPTPADWKELARTVASLDEPIMLWEAPPLASTKARLAEHGVRSAVYAPCASRPAAGDWLTVMRANVEALEAALAQPR